MIIREDATLRGRKAGDTAALIEQGAREGADPHRAKGIEVVLDEIDATKVAMSRANPGDLVLLCVDRARAVWDELQSIGHVAQAGAESDDSDDGPGAP